MPGALLHWPEGIVKKLRSGRGSVGQTVWGETIEKAKQLADQEVLRSSGYFGSTGSSAWAGDAG